MKTFKATKATFKTKLRAYSAAWIADMDEPIVGVLKNHACRDREIMNFAVSKGWLTIRDGGKYDNYHFTTLGLSIKDEVAKTTCAFSGRCYK